MQKHKNSEESNDCYRKPMASKASSSSTFGKECLENEQEDIDLTDGYEKISNDYSPPRAIDASGLEDQNVEDNANKSFFRRFMDRHKALRSKATIGLMFTFFVALLLVLPLVIAGLKNRADQRKAQEAATHNSTLPSPVSPPDHRDSFDDAARPNTWTPPLNDKFRYNAEDRIRGINLGGWLVLEPFITPRIFEQADANGTDGVIDEWTLCEHLGPDEAKRQLEQHYKTFITEDDFKKIALMGFNHVRIPTGHWAVQVTPDEPFVPYISWHYLLKGVQWARKYGLRVMVELHTAPGSQNGWNHSGRQGLVGFLDGPQGEINAERTTKIINEIVQFFNRPEWSNVVTLIGVLNEPAMMKIPAERVKKWYQTAYKVLRKTLNDSMGPILTYHDGFLPLKQWFGFFKDIYKNVVLETHLYLIFNNDLVAMPRHLQAEFPCNSWKKDLKEASTHAAPIMVGEFSLATNDCAKYLNGVGLGARYDGTLDDSSSPACANCTCEGVDDWTQFTEDYKGFLLQFLEKQMDAYESSIGWFFWTYKTENHVNPHWDYSLAWEQKFAPANVNSRTHFC